MNIFKQLFSILYLTPKSVLGLFCRWFGGVTEVGLVWLRWRKGIVGNCCDIWPRRLGSNPFRCDVTSFWFMPGEGDDERPNIVLCTF